MVSDHEQRLSALEKWQDQVNQNIESLQQLLNTTDYITSVTPLVEGGEEVGYTITFLNSDPIVIYHGKQGDKGGDGHTPQISLTQGTDGNWYWTLDGELMLDKDNNPIRANGEDGQEGQPGQSGQSGASAPTPQIKLGSTIDSGTIATDGGTLQPAAWYLSVDGGQTWYRTSGNKGDQGNDGDEGPTGPKGDSFFQGVTEHDGYVEFTLSDGTSFTVQKFQSSLTFLLGGTELEDLTQAIDVLKGDLTYEPEDAEVSARILEGEEWSASAENGTIAIKGIAGSEALLEVALTDNGRVIETYRLALEQSNLAGRGTAEDPYTVSSAAELAFFAERVNDGTNNYSGETIQLIQDIDLNGIALSIGENFYYPFSGTFDGNNRSIKGLKISNTSLEDVGLFPILMGATVKNLILENPVVEGKDYVGALVGENYGGVIENCKVINPVVKGGKRVGSLVGWNATGTIKNCQVTNTDVSGEDSVGGLVGGSGSEEGITNCSVTGTVTANANTLNGYGGTGGIVGELQLSGNKEATVIACTFSGTVQGVNKSGHDLGGIVGCTQGKGNIIACYSSGTIQLLSTDTNFENNIGGIVGSFGPSPSTIMKACYTTAEVSIPEGDDDTHLGGIAGEVGRTRSDNDPFIETCYWAQETGATNGIGWWLTVANPNQGEAKDTGTTKVDNSTVTWSAAKDVMNAALSGTDWQYVDNTDAATQSGFPLVIASQGN